MYGIKANTTIGIVKKEGYNSYSSMRTAFRKILYNRGIQIISFYEYKIDHNGFRIVNKYNLEGLKCLT